MSSKYFIREYATAILHFAKNISNKIDNIVVSELASIATSSFRVYLSKQCYRQNSNNVHVFLCLKSVEHWYEIISYILLSTACDWNGMCCSKQGIVFSDFTSCNRWNMIITAVMMYPLYILSQLSSHRLQHIPLSQSELSLFVILSDFLK